jgi:ankyrin repeat protein
MSSSIKTIDDFVAAVASNDTIKLLSFHSSLSSSSSPFNINTTDATGDTAIEVAITTSNHKLLKLLLERFKCDPNVSGIKRNQTPLRLAARRNDVKSCELLCEFGADVNATKCQVVGQINKEEENNKNNTNDADADADDGWSALHVAIFGMKKDTIQFFLTSTSVKAKIDFSLRTKREGATVLHFASAQGLHAVVADILVCTSNNNNIQDNNGDTCLHSALHYRMSKSLGGRYSPPEHPQWSIAMTLAFVGGVDPLIKNSDGETAFHFLKKDLPSLEKVLVLLSRLHPEAERDSSAAKTTTMISYEQISQVSSQEELDSKFLRLKKNPASPDNRRNNEIVSELFQSIQNLEKERNDKNEKSMKEFLAAKSKAKQQQQQSETSATYDKSIDPHGMGIDIKNLKPGEDPSNGECPFLAMRASQQKAKQENQNQSSLNQNKNLFSMRTLIFTNVVAFSLGVLFSGFFVKNKK